MTIEPAYGGRSGSWLFFASIMILILGMLNIIWGIAAIDRSDFFSGQTNLIWDDLRSWGWLILIVGAVQLLAGIGIFARSQLARWVGVAVAAVNLIGALMTIDVQPFWALAIVGIDILVIYGLAGYGGRPDRLFSPPA